MRTIEEIKTDIAIIKQSTGSGRYERLKSLNSELLEVITKNIPVERLEAICDAERDGRCVILPCKVGDKVWITLDYSVYETGIQGISVSATGNDTILHFGSYPITDAWGSDFGKTVFFTREEAEVALKRGKRYGQAKPS